jgi:hypothetical protein
MGQASMRKWLRRADCLLSGGQYADARRHYRAAQNMRTKHHTQRLRQRFKRAMIAVMEAHKDAIIARSHIKLALLTVLDRA